ncbi:4-hydroxybenzoate octaprenyltransferase, partial [Alphaproteobacteria bacterium]|nr:4-hydroxybenzoate octaprenyltransferase [Alphaproteobacteria bacterium]
MSLPDSNNKWINKVFPKFILPYIELSRLDRPIGSWLLMWPCWWSLGLAIKNEYPNQDLEIYNILLLFALFAVGSIIMRGAGCTYNDIIDRKYDLKVSRTSKRPLPSGTISVKKAIFWMIFQAFFGFLILMSMNSLTIFLGIISLFTILIYPFMKRITWWPQLFLGLSFNYGALLGWTSLTGFISLEPIIIYIAGIFWTLGYDTIYSLQDIEDDILAGIKSSSIKLGKKLTAFLIFSYTVTIFLFVFIGLKLSLDWIFW